ncbi:MAG TPA: hypothetical protein VLC09_14760 [Polyangiaceae bacterium]|nr:hypothetical protein [Polyangiaceae bacterium]
MKLARVLLLFAALFLVLWLTFKQKEAPPAPEGTSPAGTAPTAAEPGRPARAEDVLREVEKLRDTAQEVPCRPGDPLCAPAAPAASAE